jgi:predicted DNA-binding transcriptional regulator AlpA
MSQTSTGLSDHERKLGSGHTGSSRRPPEEDEVWDKAALARYLGISVSGLNKMIAARQVPPAFRLGRLWRWRRSIVFAWVHDREAESTA